MHDEEGVARAGHSMAQTRAFPQQTSPPDTVGSSHQGLDRKYFRERKYFKILKYFSNKYPFNFNDDCKSVPNQL